MESADANSEVENDAIRVPNYRARQFNYAAKQNGMAVSKVVVTCIADLAFKYTERLAKDLHLFAQHASRKSVNMEDVILCGHRNEHLSGLLRTFSNDLKAKDPQSERKRKKEAKKIDK
ncbi:hypothetical protein ACSQ67_019415 [Phaseolus vulgaris]